MKLTHEQREEWAYRMAVEHLADFDYMGVGETLDEVEYDKEDKKAIHDMIIHADVVLPSGQTAGITSTEPAQTQDPREPLVTPEELAEYLRVPRATLHQWRQRQVGPTPLKVGRHIWYRWSDVRAYLESLLRDDEDVNQNEGGA